MSSTHQMGLPARRPGSSGRSSGTWFGGPVDGLRADDLPEDGAVERPARPRRPVRAHASGTAGGVAIALVVVLVVLVGLVRQVGNGPEVAEGAVAAAAPRAAVDDRVRQPWTAGDGSLVLVGTPVLGASTSPAEGVRQQVAAVAVTVRNNGTAAWRAARISATVEGRPAVGVSGQVPSGPIAAGSVVTLTGSFLVDGGGSMQVTVDTPHGTGRFDRTVH